MVTKIMIDVGAMIMIDEGSDTMGLIDWLDHDGKINWMGCFYRMGCFDRMGFLDRMGCFYRMGCLDRMGYFDRVGL